MTDPTPPKRWVVPFPSREALVEHLASVMRDRAFPEFGAAPPPLWATDAAETIVAFYEGIAKAALMYDADDHGPYDDGRHVIRHRHGGHVHDHRLSVADGPGPEAEPCPFCAVDRPGAVGAGCMECRGRGTVGPAFRRNRGLPPLADGPGPEERCACCEDGYYCRHRCPVHPKANGLDDSGRPWAALPVKETGRS